ncbi:VIT1/CCC1 transporter family protein [Cellulomonas sp. NS3]|uniref:VIT1/CCC1 transporter family protein n=1 Tax=Cellulomonas sp. NS3 TaxID=2973977 RepID=UPI002162B2FA|nr:VIT1/CCC1 transporter family protein [Cellulomonas sp. NS3]
MTTHPSPTVLPSLPAFDTDFASRLNWLRAGVLGANDGIVSIAAMVVGVAAATPSVPAVAIAGAAGLVAGALSMASGEYVSVSSQRDAERSRAAGGVGDGEPHLTSAWHAAGASLVAFVAGGLVPLLVVLTAPAGARVPATFAAVVLALALTGHVSARLGGSASGPAVRRNVLGGGLAMAVTYGVGLLVGIAV